MRVPEKIKNILHRQAAYFWKIHQLDRQFEEWCARKECDANSV